MSRLASQLVAISICAFPIAYACSQLVVVPVHVDRVEIAPAALSLAVGATRQFTADVFDESGNSLIDRTVRWSSSNASRVGVDNDGLVVGVAPGTAVITASSEGMNAHANVTVLGSPTGPTAEIRLSDTFVSFLASQGGADPTARTVWVTSTGSGFLSGMNAVVRYGPGGTGWLIARLTSTATPTTLTLTARTGTISVGVHTATVELSAPASANVAQISVILTISSAPSGPPAAPGNLNATARGNNRIDLDWQDNSSNETNFPVLRSPLASGAWATIATLAAGTTKYQNTGLRSDTRYWYRVRACNAAGCSTSEVVTARTR